MMNRLNIHDVAAALPQMEDLQELDYGGQKQVFRARVGGVECALKIIMVHPSFRKPDDDIIDTVVVRAEREVEIMMACDCPYLVKMGSFPLTLVPINGINFLCYTEELISGPNLSQLLTSSGKLNNSEVIQLGIQISTAIAELWSKTTVHRDIKPKNIMRRSQDGDFVLLDMGLVLDLDAESLSQGLVGTIPYFSPEQTDFANRKRIMDFRSDLFSLGIVMYEMATSVHPFCPPKAQSAYQVLNNIIKSKPTPPRTHNSSISAGLERVILRLLAKNPSQRYRTITKFQDELVKLGGER